jgi:hypothetical protein
MEIETQAAGPMPMAPAKAETPVTSVPLVAAYRELAPNVYLHVLNGDTVLGGEILEFAQTHEGSQLHSVFEWDDGRAGTLWRLQQVRELLLNSLVIGPDGTADMKG